MSSYHPFLFSWSDPSPLFICPFCPSLIFHPYFNLTESYPTLSLSPSLSILAFPLSPFSNLFSTLFFILSCFFTLFFLFETLFHWFQSITRTVIFFIILYITNNNFILTYCFWYLYPIFLRLSICLSSSSSSPSPALSLYTLPLLLPYPSFLTFSYPLPSSRCGHVGEHVSSVPLPAVPDPDHSGSGPVHPGSLHLLLVWRDSQGGQASLPVSGQDEELWAEQQWTLHHRYATYVTVTCVIVMSFPVALSTHPVPRVSP